MTLSIFCCSFQQLTGLAFTFPVFLIPLVEFKVLKVSQLTKARKWVYVIVCLAVGLVNPDPTFISSIPIVVPIFVLYEINHSFRQENREQESEGRGFGSGT